MSVFTDAHRASDETGCAGMQYHYDTSIRDRNFQNPDPLNLKVFPPEDRPCGKRSRVAKKFTYVARRTTGVNELKVN
nr:hypothetical protein BaRGS_012589 [Batillaria attramentaria]